MSTEGSTITYVVVIQHEGSTWGAYSPDIPAIGVVGDTREEVEQLIRQSLVLHVERLRSRGEPVPSAKAVGAIEVRVSAD